MARFDTAPHRAARRVAGAIAVTLAAGGIPGSTLVSVERDLELRARRHGQARNGALDVSVVDGPGGAAIAGARVRVLSMIDERAYVVAQLDTGADGAAHATGLPRGEAWILADAVGRARASTHLVVEATPRAATMVLGPEHAIDVAVNDDLRSPVADAEIEVSEPGEPLPVGARTGPDGRSHVARLGAGPWRVTAHAPGFEEATGRARRDGEAVSLVLRKLGALRVRVITGDGEPAGDARIAIAGPTLWPPRTATTDAKGEVRVGSLEAGTYALRATSGDAVSAIDLDVALGRGEEKAEVLRLGPGHFVSVHATDGDASDADPVAGAQVTLAEGGLSPFPLEATTDAKGRARIGPVAPGPATLTARADGFVGRGAVAVGDPPGAETRVVLVRAGTMTGRVVDVRGDPVAGATIELAGTDVNGGPIFDDPRRSNFQTAHFEALLGGLAPLVPAGELGVVPGPVPRIPGAGGAAASLLPASASAGGGGPRAPIEPWVTGQDGTFRATPASPGRVRAIVRSAAYVEAQSEIVTLSPGGEAHVEIVLHQGGSLEGHVVDAHDRAVEGARVIVSATAGTLERTTSTASDGSFAFAGLPASVSLTVTSDDEDQPQSRTTVAIPDGDRKEVTVRLPEKREDLTVRIVDERGFGVETAQVGASSLAVDAPFRATAFTDSHGDTTMKGARGLPLRVEVRAPSRAPKIVATAGTEDELRIELAAAEAAEGEVVAARGGDPVGGAEVTLQMDFGVRRTHTGDRGAFSLTGLGPGTARLTVRAAGFAPAARAIAIPDSGGRRTFDIPRTELQAEGVVEGDVVDARGEAIAGARVAVDHVPTWLLVGANRQLGTGAGPGTFAITDAKGRFSLHQVAEGTVTLEAYAPGIGRGRTAAIAVTSGRTTDRVHLVVAPTADDAPDAGDPGAASGGVAVTLGETGAPTEVVLVSVTEGSEAERAGLAAGDVVASVDGAPVRTIDEARARLNGPIANDVLVVARRGDTTLAVRVPREAVRR